MLEQKIDKLNETIERLIVALNQFPHQPNYSVEPAALVGHKIESEEQVPTPSAEYPEPEEPKPLIREDLQDLCLQIVRSKKATKAQIKDIVAEFGGASLVKEVATADLPALKAKLEALL
jgi:hypothetical protein